MRTSCARSKRPADKVKRVLELPVTVKSPCQRRLRREIVAQGDIHPRPFDGFGTVLQHIGVEIDEVMIVVNGAAPGGIKIAGKSFCEPRLRALALAHDRQ